MKYHQGTYSPIKNRKMEAGYSEAWLHHFGRNKHHYEYWYDSDTYEKTPHSERNGEFLLCSENHGLCLWFRKG